MSLKLVRPGRAEHEESKGVLAEMENLVVDGSRRAGAQSVTLNGQKLTLRPPRTSKSTYLRLRGFEAWRWSLHPHSTEQRRVMDGSSCTRNKGMLFLSQAPQRSSSVDFYYHGRCPH